MYLSDAFTPARHGLAAVWYDSGADSPHLSGAVHYDDGGRLRMLLGQDPGTATDTVPPDVGIDTSAVPLTPLPIDMQPVSPSPMLPFIPSPVVDTVATDITGNLIPPAQQAAPISGSILTDILNAAKTIVPLAAGASSGQTIPKTAGTIVTTGPGASTAGLTSSLTKELPTIGIVAGVALVGLVLLRSFSGGGGGGRSRRRNPAELILMGANPRYGRRRR